MASLKPFGWVFTPKMKKATTIEVKPKPIVFCRDCVEYREWGNDLICMRYGSYYGNMKPNDYCSYGTLKDGIKAQDFEEARKRMYMEVQDDHG